MKFREAMAEMFFNDFELENVQVNTDGNFYCDIKKANGQELTADEIGYTEDQLIELKCKIAMTFCDWDGDLN